MMHHLRYQTFKQQIVESIRRPGSVTQQLWQTLHEMLEEISQGRRVVPTHVAMFTQFHQMLPGQQRPASSFLLNPVASCNVLQLFAAAPCCSFLQQAIYCVVRAEQ